jgi:hypothetical protein
MKIKFILLGIISFLSIFSTLGLRRNSFLRNKKPDLSLNDAFSDDLASDDKYDPNIVRKKPYHDYNNVVAVDEEKLTEKIRANLKGVNVNYKFD